MAFIQMWPPNDGSRNTISLYGRTYSSVPGVSVQVQDLDAPALQANGWTSYATIAGKTTITMLPPADGVHNQITFEGRQYSTLPLTQIESLPFDTPILQANLWSIVRSIVLQSLTLSANSFTVGAAQGTVIGTLAGTTAGSSLSLTDSHSGAVQLVSGVIQVGATPPGGSGTFSIQVTETLSVTTNSPNATTLSIIENAAGMNPILQLVMDMTVAFPLAA